MARLDGLPLFEGSDCEAGPQREELAAGVTLLRAFVDSAALLPLVEAIAAAAPFRQMTTPGGHKMSVAMTNCGTAGWITDRKGYRYEARDPLSGKPWPALPPLFLELAAEAAAQAGFADFAPDACLINLYLPGTKLSLHQDRNEKDFAQPIVSFSLGLPAIFLLGGEARSTRPRQIPLHDGDVLVFGGPARLYHHGVKELKEGAHPLLGARRINLTLRRAL